MTAEWIWIETKNQEATKEFSEQGEKEQMKSFRKMLRPFVKDRAKDFKYQSNKDFKEENQEKWRKEIIKENKNSCFKR